MMRRALLVLAVLLAVLVAAVLGVLGTANTDWGRGRIIALIEGATADGPVALKVGGIEGRLPDSIVLTDVEASDAQGAFARIARLSLDWRLLDLAGGRVAINAIEIRGAALDRVPVLPATPEVDPTTDTSPPSLKFEAPGIEVILDRLMVSSLTLGPDVMGHAVEIRADLKAALTAGHAGAAGWIEAARETGPPARVEIDTALIPASGVLRAELSVREPEGGLVAELLEIDGRPPLALSLTGEGGLEHWRGALEGGFGTGARVDLDLSVRADARGYRLGAEGSVDVARLAPEPAHALLAAPVPVNIAATLHPDGAATLDTLTLTLPSASVQATAAVDAAGVPTDGDITVMASDLSAFSALAETALSGDATVRARLDDGGRRLAIDVTGAPTGEGVALRNLALTLVAEADGPLAGLPTEVRISLDGGLDTPAVDGIDAPALLGPQVTLNVAGTVAPHSLDARVERIAVESAGVSVTGEAKLERRRRLAPVLRVTVPDLTRLRDLAGIDLSGTATVDLDGTVDFDPLSVLATISLSGDGVAFNDPALDGVVGSAPSVLAGITLDPSQRLEILGLDLRVLAARASGDISLALDEGGIGGRIDLSVPDLVPLGRAAGTALGGSAALAVALGGTLDAPAASASWRIDDLTVEGETIERITGTATAEDLADRPTGGIATTVTLRGEPVDISTAYTLDGDALAIAGLRVDGLGARIGGDLNIDLATTLAGGRISVSVADLGVLGTALGLPLTAGGIDGEITLAARGGQAATVRLSASGLALDDGTRVEDVRLDADLADLTGKPTGRLDVALSDAHAGDARLEFARLGADIRGGVAHLTVEASGTAGPEIAAVLQAALPLDPTSAPIVIDRLDASVGDVALRQTSPVTIAPAPSLAVTGIDLAVDDGRISGKAVLNPNSLDIAIAVRNLPAAVARLADPSLALDGRIDGDLTVTGPIGNPVADLRVATPGVRTLDPDLADLPPLVASAALRFADLTADATVDASIGDGALVKVVARLAANAGAAGSPPTVDHTAPLTAKVDADLDLAKVSAFLPGDLVVLTGQVGAHVSANGTVGDPILAGAVTVDGGTLDLAQAGLYLRDITVRAEGEGQDLVIRTVEVQAAGGGTLSASGSLSADPTRGFPADVALTARQFNAVDLDLASVSVDLDLALSGALPEYLLAGKVTVLPTEISIPDTLPPSVVKLDVVEMRDGRVVADPNQKPQEKAEANAPLRLDLEIDIPGQVFVRGRGLESEWGGRLDVSGLADAPQVAGEIAVRRGELKAVGQTFAFQRGRIVFDGGAPENPAIDMRLTTEVTDIKAAVVVAGRADAPDISLESDPALPEDDILARLLFGSDKAELTPVQALKLAHSAAVLSGNFGSGPGVTDQVRDALGVDTLDVDAAENDDGSVGASLSVGKYIAPGVFLKLQQGLSGASSKAVVEVEVTDNISVETDVGADSQSRVGVNWKLDY